MEHACPRCKTANPEVARFCRHCGLTLLMGPDGPLGAGAVRHPDPLPVPEGFEPLEGAPNLSSHCEAAWGGEVLSETEPLALCLFNGGYGLADVVLRIRGADESGHEVYSGEKEIELWPRGERVTVEIPSWELSVPAHAFTVTLASAQFGADS